MKASAPAVLCSATMALVVLGIDRLLPALPTITRLGLLVAAGGCAFFLIMWLFARASLKELVGLVLHRAPPETEPEPQAL
jgi:hypothetical protein